MFRTRGGNNVKGGFYWNLTTWEIVAVERGKGLLPGSATDRYIKLPVVLFVLLAPIMGLVYVVFLPLIGFVLFFAFLGRKLATALRRGIAEVRTILSPAERG